MAFTIEKAQRINIPAKISIDGPSGSGKTLTALKIARGLVGESGRIIVIDTENKSASLYAGDDGVGDFDRLNLTDDFAPERYIAAIRDCMNAGADCVIIDSASHEWMGPGGCLELVDAAAKASRSGNSYVAWGDVTPRHNAFLQCIMNAPVHIIATLRSKQDYALEEGEKGKKTVTKLGLAPQMRDGSEYEFHIAASMDLAHNMVCHKTRCSALDGRVWKRPGADVAGIIKKWLSGGAVDPVRIALDGLRDALAAVKAREEFEATWQAHRIELHKHGGEPYARGVDMVKRAIAAWDEKANAPPAT
jgi:DNA polymerase III delta prime subunit